MNRTVTMTSNSEGKEMEARRYVFSRG